MYVIVLISIGLALIHLMTTSLMLYGVIKVSLNILSQSNFGFRDKSALFALGSLVDFL
jgi:hypothetical protein